MFKIFEFITEALGWLKIAASPTLIGFIIGAAVYFPNQTAFRMVVAISIASAGLLLGIVWATKVWKTKGTIRFLSGIMTTPELDKEENEADSENIILAKKR